jgi:hypothetical protein
MSNLTLKPETASLQAGDRLIGVPTLDDAAAMAAAARNGNGARAVRHRFSATRLAQPIDDGFRPFRVY